MGVFRDQQVADKVGREALEYKNPHEQILWMFVVLIIFCLASVLKHLASTPANQRHRPTSSDTHEGVLSSDPP